MPKVFRENPPVELIEKVLLAFSLHGLHDFSWFSRTSIQMNMFEEVLPLLEPYYIPCKAKEYLYTTITTARAITILRQLLKTVDASLVCSEKSRMGVKSIWYQISLPSSSLPRQPLTEEGVLIEFD
jgi:hypothetical protein